jgi:predicted acylesterase/phospholipase RssA
MYDKVRIIYGPTGGRFAFLSGVVDALESQLLEAGISILDRVGVSGGALAAAIRASEESFPTWLTRASTIGQHVTLGGNLSKRALNTWRLITTGGMLKAGVVLDNAFRKIAPPAPFDVPCYAISWCTSSKQAVAFRVGHDLDVGLCLFASCAMPIAFSQVQIKNKELPIRVQLELGLLGKPDSISTFRDGGLSPVFPGDLIRSNIHVPTIVINISGKAPKDRTMFARMCYAAIKSKELEGIEEASKTRPVELINIPVPPAVDKFATKFDITKEDGMLQYKLGLKAGRVAANTFLKKAAEMKHFQYHQATQG